MYAISFTTKTFHIIFYLKSIYLILWPYIYVCAQTTIPYCVCIKYLRRLVIYKKKYTKHVNINIYVLL